ncbi:alpha-glucan family phosphorylase [Propionibacterium freudenreichii]|uniref:alpha-glucan family phosphorylase n=1 Tax=Propionibacterium freudenreichii TaxID=1744 RepID=UPI001107C7DE|nr:alpha-glucan family phosphorylase [Propionibacterium freudenreichii]MCT2976268.1 glycosyltransferase family 1 protein [Propionibacterium freudenreichii]MDK9351046.1 alpha-glucan family phosphorylase [Propionibacterium freudenreichii]
MRAIRRFIVQPVLPESLKPLAVLARNLRWSWHQDTQDLFEAIDPVLWEETSHDPQKLLSRASRERLDTLAGDRRYLRHLELAAADLSDYVSGDRWYQGFVSRHPEAPKAIGYFSAEFGVSSVLPQYSGGLGVLAGDHLKSASDLGVPIIGVGLLYTHGYFRQSLNAAGWQQEHYPVLDPNELPVEMLREDGEPVTITLTINHRPVVAQLWVAQVGRVPLLFMDTNVDANDEAARSITDRLYGGSADHRLAQEILLGVGGVRALRAFCRVTGRPDPDVYHCNEGHAGFLGLERIREYMTSGDDFDTAWEKTRAGNVFTTHTPVPAGIDRFGNEQVANEFGDFTPLPIDRVLALGAEDYEGGDPSRFNMAVMGLRLGEHANGVSRLHGKVSREMFQGLWPDFDVSEVPIGSVTNGVHAQSWIHPDLLELLQAQTGDSGTVVDGLDLTALDRVDDNTLWSLKRQMRGEMIKMARERLVRSCKSRGMSSEWVSNALNPHVLTIGFARRGASYKRLTLMIQQPERLKKLLNDPEHPVQIVIAGKAHPADDIGKGFIQQMVQFSDDPEVRGKLVFLPDYDISLARPLYPGCDVWLNNPLRPQEACGTSGMKAALNGAANLSILDGWWDEWYDPAYGWAIPSATNAASPEERDRMEAESLYQIIERDVVPKFYARDANGLPTGWITMMRETMEGLGPKILATRMVRDYVTDLYTPAAQSASALLDNDVAANLAAWKQRVRQAWDGVAIDRVESDLPNPVAVGSRNVFSAWVKLGSLEPTDVSVQVVSGDVDADDQIHNVRIFELAPTDQVDQQGQLFRANLVSAISGSIGYTVRVVPKHPLLHDAAELGLATVATAAVAEQDR